MNPKDLVKLLNYHSSFFHFDVAFGNDSAISCDSEWLLELEEIRRALWPNDKRQVNMPMLAWNVQTGNLLSLLSPIPQRPQPSS